MATWLCCKNRDLCPTRGDVPSYHVQSFTKAKCIDLCDLPMSSGRLAFPSLAPGTVQHRLVTKTVPQASLTSCCPMKMQFISISYTRTICSIDQWFIHKSKTYTAKTITKLLFQLKYFNIQGFIKQSNIFYSFRQKLV